jgi:tRNA pseudouridine13 synthase
MSYESHVDGLTYAHGKSIAGGLLKKEASHFKVYEELSFEPSGEGEHVFLYVQKTNCNTDDVAKILAKFAHVPRRAVSYAGMKDRLAVTQQWFSVHLPGKEGPNWEILNNSDIQILKRTRHLKKLKRGAIKFNQFDILLSEIESNTQVIHERAQRVRNLGVPNYFMHQRFGYLAQNLTRAYELFSKNQSIKNKKMKSIFLSSARSFLFNEVLSTRVSDATWEKPLKGDAYILDGSRQFFQSDDISEELEIRMLEHDIHSSGPLFGIGDSIVRDDVKDIEELVFFKHPVFCDGLKNHRVEGSRRQLRVVPEAFKVNWEGETQLRLQFKLPSGSYATAVVRELINVS